MTDKKKLNLKGEFDYDYVEDILFFKAKNREYDRSIELDRFAIDVDEENYIVGIQIFDASEFLRIPKEALRNIKEWQFEAEVSESRLEIRFIFRGIVRNKIIERSPIIIESVEKEELPDSKVVCTVP